jgi:hypothetical protein
MPGVFTNFQDFERGTIYAFGSNFRTLLRPGNSHGLPPGTSIDWGNFGQTTLPDGDFIKVDFSQNSPQADICITLNTGPGVTWWKALSLFTPGRGDFHEIFTEGTKKNTATITVNPSIFDTGDVYVHFKKAKFFWGIHMGIYFLGRADRLIGTHATFTWLKD